MHSPGPEHQGEILSRKTSTSNIQSLTYLIPLSQASSHRSYPSHRSPPVINAKRQVGFEHVLLLFLKPNSPVLHDHCRGHLILSCKRKSIDRCAAIYCCCFFWSLRNHIPSQCGLLDLWVGGQPLNSINIEKYVRSRQVERGDIYLIWVLSKAWSYLNTQNGKRTHNDTCIGVKKSAGTIIIRRICRRPDPHQFQKLIEQPYNQQLKIDVFTVFSVRTI